MQLKSLFADEGAVSPVIGVILMVAITVILAAVIGTFVLGLGNQVQSTTPQATFTANYQQEANTNTAPSPSEPTDVLNVTHDGGAKIPGNQLNFSVSGAETNAGTPAEAIFKVDGFSQDSVSAGNGDSLDRYSFGTSGSAPPVTSVDLSAATVRVVWSSESGDNSATLRTWSGPDA